MSFIRVHFILLLVAGSSLSTIGQVNAAGSESSMDQWQFSAEVYVFLPDVETTSTSGDTMEIKIDDLLSNLDFYFSGALAARKNKFLLMADLFYYKGSGDANFTARDTTGITKDVNLDIDADLTITPS